MNQPTTTPFRVVLANPRGFCAGVERAIEIVERALIKYGPPVYVRHEIVHNKRVVEDLRAKGAVFVEELDEIPTGGVTIFSAHGVSESVENEASRRELPVIDATCPLVSKVHREGQRYAERGFQTILIGHEGHPEVEGTRGRIPGGVILVSSVDDVDLIVVGDPSRVSYVTQTTLSVDDTRDIIEALKRRFPAIVGPDVRDICYATQNRQRAVRELTSGVDVLIVVGARNSSNSNRLREIGGDIGVPSYLINDASELSAEWLTNAKVVGVTAGASAPEKLVQEVIDRLRAFGASHVAEHAGVEESVRFRLPDEVANVNV
ncbi:MAG: 4-hydroxy-3-methylbut-2-enyl diphosphate reductase [Alphaproteobacteria bacterium]|nr:4-hydroxy-3-methylbut-2-enyl diphosphate reductase [Alphaproteobacteria bacterium]